MGGINSFVWEMGQHDTNSPLLADRPLLTGETYTTDLDHMGLICSPTKAVSKIVFSFKHVCRVEGTLTLTSVCNPSSCKLQEML